MVHTANLFATDTKVTQDGTISTTWKISDKFDYYPYWNKNKTLSQNLLYNGHSFLISPIYHGLFGATQVKTNADWNQTYPPVEK